MLEGFKTYFFWVMAGLTTIAFSQGIIGQVLYTFLMGIFVPGGAISQRMATSRTERKIEIAAQAATEAAAAAHATKAAVTK